MLWLNLKLSVRFNTAHFLRPQYDQDFFYLCFKVHVHLQQTGVTVVGDGAKVTYHQPPQSSTTC